MLRNVLPSLRQHLHLAVQGHVARRRHRRARAHLLRAEDQQRELPRHRDLDRRKPALCRAPARCSPCCCASSSGAWRSRGDARCNALASDQLWNARCASSAASASRCSISLLAIVARHAARRRRRPRADLSCAGPLYWLVRIYTDFIRGTPVLVLILASFYILGTIGWTARRLPGRRARARAFSARAMSARSSAVRCRRSRRARPKRPRRSASPSADLRLRAAAAGGCAGAAGLGQHRGRDGQGLDTAVDHRRGRAAAGDAGADRPQLHEPAHSISSRASSISVINFGIERLGRYVETQVSPIQRHETA